MSFFGKVKEKTMAAGKYLEAEHERYEKKQNIRRERELKMAMQEAKIAKERAAIAAAKPKTTAPLGPSVFGSFNYSGGKLGLRRRK